MKKTVTRLYDHYAGAARAVSELEAIGINGDDISLIANNAHDEHGHKGINDDGDVTNATAGGAVVGGGVGLLAGLGILAIPGLGPVVAAGWLAATGVGLGVGAIGGAATGSIVGALKNAGHSDEEANFYSEGVRRGGTLVSAKVPNDRVTEAEAVLDRNKAVDRAARDAAYRGAGWQRFDETAPAFTAEEIERERALYAPAVRS